MTPEFVTGMTIGGAIFGALSILFLMLGRNEIVNKLKHKALGKKGWSYFLFFTNGGYAIEKVLRRTEEIKWKGKTYLFNKKYPFKYDTGGNVFMEGNANPVNLAKLYKLQDSPELNSDPELITTIIKRAYNLGKIKAAGVNKMDQMMTYIIIGGFALIGFLTYKNGETLTVVQRACGA